MGLRDHITRIPNLNTVAMCRSSLIVILIGYALFSVGILIYAIPRLEGPLEYVGLLALTCFYYFIAYTMVLIPLNIIDKYIEENTY